MLGALPAGSLYAGFTDEVSVTLVLLSRLFSDS